MIVREIMNKKVDVINFDRPVREAAEMMAHGNYGALPVERDDKMVGMITDRDIALRVVGGNKNLSSKVGECMSTGIEYCFDDEDVGILAEKMKIGQIHRIPIVNREKKLVGIVSTKELVRNAHNEGLTQRTFEGILS